MVRNMLAALVAMLAVSAVRADPPSATSSGTARPSSTVAGNGEIVVHGVRAREIETFVQQMTDARDTGQVTRWNDAVCPQIINLQPALAKTIGDKILAVARAAKAPLPAAGDDKPCKPNILIVFTADADDMVKQIHQKYRQLFEFPSNNDRPDADYAVLMKPNPIRWIVASDSIGQDGNQLSNGSVLGEFGAPVNADLGQASNLHLATKRTTTLVVEIVDATKLANISTTQLGEYLALVALSKPRLDTAYRGSTLLAMFADRDQGRAIPAGLTDQDRNFLRHLYDSDPLHDGDHQRASIAYRMRHGTQAGADGADDAKSSIPPVNR